MTSAITQTSTIAVERNSTPRRDLSTQILHADEEAYAKQLEPFGGKEDMTQGGDVYVLLLAHQAWHTKFAFQLLSKPSKGGC